MSRPAARLTAAWVLVALCALAALVPARSYDLWWHLETGRQIVRTGTLPSVDDYSFTSAGTPWIDHSWLFQVILYGFYLSGPAGLTVLKLLCVLGVALIGFRRLITRGVSPMVALGLISVAVVGMRPRLGERPETVTLLMAALVVWLLLELADRPERPLGRLVGLAMVTILWSNLHGGALLAPVMALAIAVSATAIRPRRAAAPLWVAVLMSMLCLLVNPYGPGILSVPAAIRNALSPANLDNPEWARPGYSDSPLFYATLAVCLILMVVDLLRRRPLAPSRAAVLLVAGGMAVTSIRHTGIFFALLPMMIEPVDMPLPRSARAGVAAGVMMVVAVTLYMTFYPPAGARLGIGVDWDRFPVKAADFVDKHLVDARLYNDVASGGYLIWRGYPGRRVFIDGRNEVHAALLQELSGSLDDGRRWQALLDRYGVEGAVLAYRSGLIDVSDAMTGRRSRSTFSELHFPQALWALVHWDDVAMVFVRRQGRFAEVAATLQYRHVRPEAWVAGALPDSPGTADPALAGEIIRKSEEDPDCHLARAAAARYRVGRPFSSR